MTIITGLGLTGAPASTGATNPLTPQRPGGRGF
jgi:hypothetical protein